MEKDIKVILSDPESMKAIGMLVNRGYPPDSIGKVMEYLSKIETLPVEELNENETPEETLDSKIFEFLTSQYVYVVGPIAEFIINDNILDMGYTKRYFPKKELPELIAKLLKESKKRSKKKIFLENIKNELLNIDGVEVETLNSIDY